MAEIGQRMAIYSLTSTGLGKALRLADGLITDQETGIEVEIFAPERLAGEGMTAFPKLSPAVKDNWDRFEGHIFFCASGIVIRTIAPLIQAKDADPAVICLDQQGQFAISLLAGHLGGANELAQRAAAILGGQAVITTATDTEGLPSLEMEARKLGLKVENLAALAGVSTALLEGRRVPIYDPGLALGPILDWEWPDKFQSVEDQSLLPQGLPAVVVDWRIMENPDPAWLVLRPPCLALGLGCNRGTEAKEILEFIDQVMAQNRLAPGSIARLASVDAKADEAGLLEAAGILGLNITFYDRAELADIKTPNPSAMVEKHLGVKSVCEAAALLAAKTEELLVKKNKKGNVTLSIAKANK